MLRAIPGLEGDMHMSDERAGESSGANIFEQGSPLKTYLTLAMPVVVSMLISVVYNIADTYFIAATQNTQLVAGVSLCAPIFTILMAFGNIFGQGGSSMISRLFGQGKTRDTKAVSSFCFYISLLTGLVIGIIMLLFPGQLLGVLGADVDTIIYARPYYLTMAVGAPFVVANFIHMNLLRSEGMASQSMIGSVSGLLLNVILDPIFISGLGWGAFGAAFASVLGYVFSDVFLLIIVLRKSKILSIDPRIVLIEGSFIRQIFGVGISAAVTNWMSSICLIITNQFLLVYGSDQIAAMGIAQKVIMVPLLITTGLVFGSAPIIGYYYGGHRYPELKTMLKMIFAVVEGVTILLSLVIFAAAVPAVKFFLTDATVVSAGALMIRFLVVTLALATFVSMTTVCFQAAGLGLEALIISICRQGIVFLIVVFIANALAGYMGVLASQAIADVITTIFAFGVFWKRFFQKLK